METEKTPEKIDIFIYINRFLKAFGKLWILVLLLPALLGGGMYFRAKANYRPMYSSKAIFSVSSGYAGDDIFTNPYYYDTASASQLVTSFPSMLNTDVMRDLLMARLDKSYINGSIQASTIADTNLFQLTVTSSSCQDAYDILCAVIECYPQVMVYSMDNPQLIIRQTPTMPDPKHPVNTFDGSNSLIKGAAAGLILSLGLIFLAGMSIHTVSGAKELKKLVNLPQLAVFPHVNLKKRRKSVHTFLNAEDDQGLSEALRGLRTKVRKQLDDRNGKVVLLTSTVPAEGKSTISANLACLWHRKAAGWCWWTVTCATRLSTGCSVGARLPWA